MFLFGNLFGADGCYATSGHNSYLQVKIFYQSMINLYAAQHSGMYPHQSCAVLVLD